MLWVLLIGFIIIIVIIYNINATGKSITEADAQNENSPLVKIKKHLISKGLSDIGSMREITELPTILQPYEQIEFAVKGFYKTGNGILVATNSRAIFIDKGITGSLRVEDFPYDKISSVQYETSFVGGTVTIHASGNNAEIKHIENNAAKRMGEGLRKLINTPKENPTKDTPQADDIISKLERLNILKEKGILTEAEFSKEKAKLLS